MNKFFEQLQSLDKIDELIRKTEFTAIQEAIAKEMNISVRTICEYFVFLRKIGAPIVLKGRQSHSGCIYSVPSWDLWTAL